MALIIPPNKDLTMEMESRYFYEIRLLIRQYAEHGNRRMKSDFANTIKQCAHIIEKLSVRLREVDPKDLISSELCLEADQYLNALTLLKDDKTFYPKQPKDVWEYANAKSKEAGWGVDKTPAKKKKRK